MKLMQLEMTGFGPFYDKTTLTFATDPDQHITVIHGENGAGKTTVLNAILWCLTGTVSPSLQRELIKAGETNTCAGLTYLVDTNKTPTLDANIICEVVVTFLFKGTEYVARRVGTRDSLAGKFYLSEKVSGILDEFTDPDGVIERIFPSGVSGYFMFDGEGFKSENSEETGFEASVKRVLGFSFARDALDKLGQIKKNSEAELNRLRSKDIKDTRAREEYQSALEELEAAQETSQTAKKNRDVANGEVRGISEQIGRLDSEDIRNAQAKYDQTKADIRRLEHQHTLKVTDRFKLIQKHFRTVFSGKLYTQGSSFIEDNVTKGVIPAPYSDRFINDLIEVKECICGREIHSEQVEILKKHLEQATTALLTDRLSKARAVSSADRVKFEGFKAESIAVIADIRNIESQISTKKELLEDLNSQLEAFAGIDEQLEELRSTQNEFIKAERAFEVQYQEAESAAVRAKYKVDKYKPPKNFTASIEQSRLESRIKKLSHLIRQGEMYLDFELTRARDFIRSSMTEKISKAAIEHNVKLNDDFTSRYVNTAGTNIVANQGARKTLEFAFLCSLVALIKQWSSSHDRILVPGTLAPLVVDAPFSQVDEDNQRIIGEMLLDASDQLIFLLINDQWANLEQLIGTRKGAEYLLIKNMVFGQHDRPEKRENFNGKSYWCARYGAEYNHTAVEELYHV